MHFSTTHSSALTASAGKAHSQAQRALTALGARVSHDRCLSAAVCCNAKNVLRTYVCSAQLPYPHAGGRRSHRGAEHAQHAMMLAPPLQAAWRVRWRPAAWSGGRWATTAPTATSASRAPRSCTVRPGSLRAATRPSSSAHTLCMGEVPAAEVCHESRSTMMDSADCAALSLRVWCLNRYSCVHGHAKSQASAFA